MNSLAVLQGLVLVMAVVPGRVCGVAATLQVPQHQVGQDVPVRLLEELLKQAQTDDADLGEGGREGRRARELFREVEFSHSDESMLWGGGRQSKK